MLKLSRKCFVKTRFENERTILLHAMKILLKEYDALKIKQLSYHSD